MKQLIALIFCLFLGQFLSAQELSSKVVDEETGNFLIGANVIAFSETDTLYFSTNILGDFSIPNIDKYQKLKISYLGYKTLEVDLTEDNIASEFKLEVDESNIAVNPIIIANPFLSNDVSFNRKEFQILPGAYEDPSRLLLKAPGFTTSNDQANSILYKGFPSNLINWNINGALIVNPNHLSNAGTLSDVSSANAGGVNMISGQVIGTYDFQSAPYDLPGNNAIAGNSDIEFSDYNNSYLNLSLIGLEAGLGVNGKKIPGAQINYRYSTVGILTGPLGLDFGGEEIVYQDLFSKLNLIDKEGEKLSVFLAAGISHNYKDSVAVRDSAETFKDLQNIYFDSRILLGGAHYEKSFGDLEFKSSLNFSNKADSRSSSSSAPFTSSSTDVNQQIISGLFELKKNQLSYGLSLHHLADQRENMYSYRGIEGFANQVGLSNFNLMPYVNYEKQGSWYYIKGGTGITYNSATSNVLLEPQVKFVAELSNLYEAELSYRRNSQLIPASNFSYSFEPKEVIGDHVEAYFRFRKDKVSGFVNGFYHYMNQILVEENSFYSQFTAVDRTSIGAYNYDGKASIAGTSIGFSTRNLVLNGLNLTANATFFSARYATDQNQWVQNTFSFGESYNFLASYQRKLSKDREWLTSFSVHVRGGLNEFLIDEVNSLSSGNVVYNFNNAPLNRLAGYSRMDFRFVYNLRKGQHRRFAKSISLDIQNIGNVENEAYTNYDFYTLRPYVQKQLGLIPVIAYRIEF